MFIHHSRVYLHHTDAAGRLFFANQFYLIHEAKEHFLEYLGFDLKAFMEHPRFTFPLVHAESDFKLQLKTADKIEIAVCVEKIGDTSVTFLFTITKEGALAGTAKTVNVSVDKLSGIKTPLLDEWRKLFCKGLRLSAT